jgi:hypothetical protein
MNAPDLSIAGWTLTDEQFTAAVAILGGILGVVIINALTRRAARVAIGLAISGLVTAAWWWAARTGHLPDLPLG